MFLVGPVRAYFAPYGVHGITERARSIFCEFGTLEGRLMSEADLGKFSATSVHLRVD